MPSAPSRWGQRTGVPESAGGVDCFTSVGSDPSGLFGGGQEGCEFAQDLIRPEVSAMDVCVGHHFSAAVQDHKAGNAASRIELVPGMIPAGGAEHGGPRHLVILHVLQHACLPLVRADQDKLEVGVKCFLFPVETDEPRSETAARAAPLS